jgi:hypothetical protein
VQFKIQPITSIFVSADGIPSAFQPKGNMKMRKLIILAALAFAFPALAAELTMGTVLGTTMPEVQTNLTGMGYQVRKSEMEDGKIEVYFVKGNKKGEIYVSTATGKVTKLKVK